MAWANPIKDASVSTIVAGMITVLVGHASALAIVFQGATAAGASTQMLSSWVLALGIGMGVLNFSLSWFYKVPIIIAWSTPGAALLATSLSGQALSDVIGAFIFVAVLTIILGVTGWFSALMKRIPLSIAAAMLAGVLLQFGIEVFAAIVVEPVLVGGMIAGFLLARRYAGGYAVAVVLFIGVVLSMSLGLFEVDKLSWSLAEPVWVTPTFDLSVLIGIGLPLFVVTMTAQNMPGVAVLRTSGYDTPVSGVITSTGVAGLLLAPFGGFIFNLAAFSAAICTSSESHPDKSKRYVAGMSSGFFNVLVGVFGGTLIGLMASFPAVMITTLAGLALLGVIANGLATAMIDTTYRDAALITFLVTISGVQFFNIAAAFWGILAGMLAMVILPRPVAEVVAAEPTSKPTSEVKS